MNIAELRSQQAERKSESQPLVEECRAMVQANERLQRFFAKVYTVKQLAERLEVDECDVWTWLATYRLAVPPYRHGDECLFLRSWIEEWIEKGMPAVKGMVEHRREINRLLSAALGCPPAMETIPSEYPVVGMTHAGRPVKFDHEGVYDAE